MDEMIFWGATGQAKVLKECMEHSNIKLTALFDNNLKVKSSFSNVQIYYGKAGFEDWFTKYKNVKRVGFLIAIGGDKGKTRIDLYNYLLSYGLEPLTAMHPTAFIANTVKIGSGSQILANSTICVDGRLGKCCIINTGSIIDHECVLEDGVHIAPGASLAGCVHIGKYTMIGTGAVILPRINIGEHVVVGAGSVVTKNITDNCIVYGNPAKVIKMNRNML